MYGETNGNSSRDSPLPIGRMSMKKAEKERLFGELFKEVKRCERCKKITPEDELYENGDICNDCNAEEEENEMEEEWEED